MEFLTAFLIGLVLNVVAYMLMPKPKQAKPPEAQDGEDPVAEAGKTLPVVFGTMIVKELNVLWFGVKEKNNYTTQA